MSCPTLQTRLKNFLTGMWKKNPSDLKFKILIFKILKVLEMIQKMDVKV